MNAFKLRILTLVLAVLAGPLASAQSYVRPFGDGMPLPWPFPWAKDCDVDWAAMEGRYLLTPSKLGMQLDLKISVVAELNFTLIRVSRYGQDGQLLADGYVWVSAKQKTVRLWLFPLRRGDPPTWAVLKLHYTREKVAGCPAEFMIPILTLDQVDNTTHTQAQYKLIRVGKN